MVILYLKKKKQNYVIMRQTTAGMDNFRDLLEEEDRVSAYSNHLKAIACCALIFTHFFVYSGGVVSGVFFCQDGTFDCSYDGSST